MRLGPLRPADRARLSELLVATRAFNADEVEVALSLFDLGMGSPATGSEDDSYEFVGVFVDDRLMGYACFGPTPSTEGTYDLYWLAVDPSAQGQGLGRALCGEVDRPLPIWFIATMK